MKTRVQDYKCESYTLRIDKKTDNRNENFDYDLCDYKDAILLSASVGSPAHMVINIMNDDNIPWHRIMTSNVVGIEFVDDDIIVETENSFYKFRKNK